jgi:hypothetical protein
MSALRHLSTVAAGVCAASALSVSPAHAAGTYAGSWTATDVPDGSALSLSIQGVGPRYAVREVDAAATVCGGAPATVSGRGREDGPYLVATVTLACEPGGNVFREHVQVFFSYDAGTDTLTDNEGVVWYRA